MTSAEYRALLQRTGAGDADGRLSDGTPYFGRLRKVAYDADEDKVQCHLCGNWFKWVGGLHLALVHGWKIADYRRAFGLNESQSTMAAGSRARLREIAVTRLSDAQLGSPLGGGAGLQSIDWHSFKERRPDLVGELHPTRNSDLDPATLGVWSNEPVWWRCNKCAHEWRATISGRAAYPGGCPACGPRAAATARHRGPRQPLRERSLQALRPDLTAELHPTRNGDLDPATLGVWAKRRIWWRCRECAHEWQALVMNRQQGNGCPRCAKARRRATFQKNASPAPRPSARGSAGSRER